MRAAQSTTHDPVRRRPKAGTVIRSIFDRLMAEKGRFVPCGASGGQIEYLRNFYGCVINQKPGELRLRGIVDRGTFRDFVSGRTMSVADVNSADLV